MPFRNFFHFFSKKVACITLFIAIFCRPMVMKWGAKNHFALLTRGFLRVYICTVIEQQSQSNPSLEQLYTQHLLLS